MSPPAPTAPCALPALLDTLSPELRDVVAVLALSTVPMPRGQWHEEVKSVGLRVDGLRTLTGESFKALARRLEEASIVRAVPERPGVYFVEGALVAPVLEDARLRGRLGGLSPPRHTRSAHLASFDAAAHLRRAIAARDPERLAAALGRLSYTRRFHGEVPPLVAALTLAAPAGWMEQLPANARAEYLREALHFATVQLRALGEDVLAAAAASPDAEVRGRVAVVHALSGRSARAREEIAASGGTSPWELGALAVASLTEGAYADALEELERAAATGSRASTRTKAAGKNAIPGRRLLRGLPSYLAVLDLLLTASPLGRAVSGAELVARVERARPTLREWYWAGDALAYLAAFRATGRGTNLPTAPERATWLDRLACALALLWAPPHAAERRLLRLDGSGTLGRVAEANGFTWVARELRSALDGLPGERPDEGTLAALRPSGAPWELALEALSDAVVTTQPTLPTARSQPQAEVVWVVGSIDVESDSVDVTARLVRKPGTLGTAISFAKLVEGSSLPLQAEDTALVAALVAGRHYGNTFTLRPLVRAIGHPRVRDAAGQPLSIERGTAEVRVTPTTGGMRIEMVPARFAASGAAVIRDADRLVVHERTETAARLVTVLGDHGLEVPSAGLAKVVETLAAIGAHVPVRGVEALGEATGAKAEPADERLRVQLFRAGTTFRARLRVVPGGHEGPTLRPGVEPTRVLVAGEGTPRHVVRDLEAERAAVERLLAAGPILAEMPRDGDDHVAPDLESCLELLLALAEARSAAPGDAADQVLVEWPSGDPLRPPWKPDDRQLKIRVKSTVDWLTVDAELELDEGRVLGFAELLQRTSAARGRFVALADGEYLALTEKLREQIEALGRVETLSDRQGRISPALLPALAQLADGASLDLTRALEQRLEALEKTLGTTPAVPRALKAELRDYQRDGFVFLARRAASGLGACLADDMGLGKTVQALALLLSRRTSGAALVVAPMSVCKNWEAEARRFAPTLAVHPLAESVDRLSTIESVGPGDVLLVSYGLLVSSCEALAARRFATVVFDEAHALKTHTTRRAAAARKLSADALVGLSGTPLENRLGELHSLFEVLAPGLLGTRERFERAFGGPIAQGDKRATAQLRSLVRPLLLRRTKAEVLSELPEKTEMTRVLTEAERHFYEALRRQAARRALAAASEGGPNARISILAEITKLRRAAIDPRLVGGEEAPVGGKLEALVELVRELREEGHRALVFSQFLEVLDRAGDKLAEIGVTHVRLDGTMDAKARAAAVDAFQSGAADVFLLSLRAGGVGMNLTAADYVIHLDPWWNPAVEDQATDRAHRIGQTRPVTVVRLVTEGTIADLGPS